MLFRSAVIFFMALYLQVVEHQSPLRAGVLLLPATIPILLANPIGTRFGRSRGAWLPTAIGMVLLAVAGIKLPGLNFSNQRVEAAYRKELVHGEDDPARASPQAVRSLFDEVRTNYFRLFFHYLYFDVAKWSYLQFGVLVPYLALGPTIVAGALTLGTMQQIIRAFGKVQDSFQYLVTSWSTIVELISIYKRLRAFERQIQGARG